MGELYSRFRRTMGNVLNSPERTEYLISLSHGNSNHRLPHSLPETSDFQKALSHLNSYRPIRRPDRRPSISITRKQMNAIFEQLKKG